jgi:hypothetical protein
MNQPAPAKPPATDTQKSWQSEKPDRSDTPGTPDRSSTPGTPEKPQSRPRPPQSRGPIVGERDVGRFEFLYRRLPTSAHVAHVLVTNSGRRVVCQPDKHPTTGELLWSGARTVYEVDLGIHVIRIVATPPSQGDKTAFRAVIDVIWKVADPAKVVLTGLSDVRQAVSPSLLHQLRAITRQYKIAELENAEETANERLRHSTLGAEFGLTLEVYVRLTMDEASLYNATVQRKVDLFRKIISAGDFNQFALELALEPNDIGAVVKMLMDERDSHRQAMVDFVTRLLESDALDRWQIEDQVRTTLQWIQDSGNKVITGSDEARKFSYGENHREPIDISDNGSGAP